MSEQFNSEAEQILIGGLLQQPGMLHEVETTSEDMAIEAHKLIYQSIERLYKHNQPVDVITVSSDLDEANQLLIVGGLAYLTECLQSCASTKNLKRYSQIVKGHSASRVLLSISDDLAALAANVDGQSIQDRLGEAEKRLQNVSATAGETEPVLIKTAMADFIDAMDARVANSGVLPGVKTGLEKLDRELLGYQKGDLVIIAGRPSMGKTSLATIGAAKGAIAGIKTAFFSLEMSRISLVERIAACVGEIDLKKIRSGRLEREDFERLTNVISKIETAPLWIDDAGSLTVGRMLRKCRRLKAKHGLDAVYIDQLSHIPKKGDNLAQAIGEVTREVKAMAKELNVPVILLSQLNRESAKSKSVRRPELTDLRDSGCIEQDADVVVYVHRPSYYDETQHPGLAELIIAKQRQGEKGKVITVGWNGANTLFSDKFDPMWTPPASSVDHEDDGYD